MINLGTVDPGSTIYIPFESFASSTGAPITITGLATSDILVYKDGSMTQRASASGFTLLDTDGIDIDGITGIHGFSIDLADNTTADFWAAGSKYFVVVSAITVDSQTMSFIAATFKIGKPGAILDTTIATLSSQTSFTLTSGPAEDDALNGHWAIIHDAASAVQFARVLILDYTGSTKTVTLAAGATFTAAAKDNFSVMGMAPIQAATIGRSLAVDASGQVPVQSGTGAGQIALTSGKVSPADNSIAAATIADGAITNAKFGTTPGSAGGLMIAGSNAATTYASMTCTGAFTVSDGIIVSASTSNREAMKLTGNGSAAGLRVLSGASSADAALLIQAQGTNDSAIRLIGTGTRHGIYATGGDTGHGVYFGGGSTSGDGARFEAAASGHGLNVIGIGSGKYDLNAGSLGASYMSFAVSGNDLWTTIIAHGGHR